MRAVLVLILLLVAPSAMAQSPPACARGREGQLACMGGTLCACRFERGGQLTGRSDRFAWDCGPLRPSCPPDPTIEPTQPWAPPAGIWLAPSRR